MNRNSIYTVYLSLFFFGISFLAQANIYDAKSASLGNIRSCLKSSFPLFNGISQLSEMEENSAASLFNIPFGIVELSQSAFEYNHSIQDKTLALGLSRKGNNTFIEESLLVGIGVPISSLNTGIALELVQFNLENHGSQIVPIIDIGSSISLIPKFKYGIQINNLFQNRLSELDPVESEIIIGASYELSQKLNSYLDFEKSLYDEDEIRLGLEYLIHPNLNINLGLRSNNLFPTAGIQIYKSKIQFNYAFVHNLNIGSSHFISLSYVLQKKTN